MVNKDYGRKQRGVDHEMCKCLQFLMTFQDIPGKAKGQIKFVDSGLIVNFTKNPECEGISKPILRAMKEGKDGRLTWNHTWMPLKFCPVCGTAVYAWSEA